MIAGAAVTVSVADEVVTVASELVNTAWYRFPFCAVVTAVNVRVADVAPMIFVNAPPLTLTCHCTVGTGLPLAVAVKLALLPAATV